MTSWWPPAPSPRFLEAIVAAGLNVLVSGGTQAGKATLLNCLLAAIPARERVVTCEEVFELRVALPHSRPRSSRSRVQANEGVPGLPEAGSGLLLCADMVAIEGWAHVTLSVRDHDRSLRWYGDVLGFRPLASETTDQWQRTLCGHPGSGTVLVLHQHLPTTDDEQFDERRIGLDHVAFAVSDPDDLLAWQEQLTFLAVQHSPITDAPPRGGKVLSFRDPDGIALELFYRPSP